MYCRLSERETFMECYILLYGGLRNYYVIILSNTDFLLKKTTIYMNANFFMPSC